MRRSKTKWFGVYSPSGNRIGLIGAPNKDAAKKKAAKRFGGTGPYVI